MMKAIRYASVSLLLILVLTACGGGAPSEEDINLSGDWQGILSHVLVEGPCPTTPTQQGTVRVEQDGSAFTMQFGEGFTCNPPEACAFSGEIDGLVLTASNGGPADTQGGTYTTTMTVVVSPGGETADGTGTSMYVHPEMTCEWTTSLTLTRGDSE